LKASVTEHLGWGATVTTTEAAAGSIKAEQRRPEKRRQNRETERLGTKEKLGETEDRNP
jgi:hypothetical protein